MTHDELVRLAAEAIDAHYEWDVTSGRVAAEAVVAAIEPNMPYFDMYEAAHARIIELERQIAAAVRSEVPRDVIDAVGEVERHRLDALEAGDRINWEEDWASDF